MTNKKISELPDALALTGNEQLLINQNEITRKVTVDALLAEVVIPGPVMGEIRYFPDVPSEPGWLACNGQPHLRTAYPAYEAKRPEAAWKFENVTASRPMAATNIILSTGTSLYTSTGDGVFRSTDQMATSTKVLTGVNYATAFAEMPSGRIVAISWNNRNCHYSDDDGVTWTTVVNAHTQMPVIGDHGPVNIQHLVVAPASLTVPVVGTDKWLSTTDGAIWTESIINFSWSTPVITVFPWVMGGYPQPGYETSNFMFTGAKDAGIERYGTYAAYSPTYHGYLSRPGIVISFTKVKGIFYESCMHHPRILKIVTSGAVDPISPLDSGFTPSTLITISNRLLSLETLAYRPSHEVAWMNANETALESGTLIPAEFTGANTWWVWGNYGVVEFPDHALMSLYDPNWNPVIMKISTDASKFNAPGLPAVADASPYVYVGV